MNRRRTSWTRVVWPPWIGAVLLAGCAAERESLAPSPSTASEPARSEFMEGIHHFNLQRMAEARASFDRSIAADPQLALAYAYRALAKNYVDDPYGDLEESARLAAGATAMEQALIRAARAWYDRDYATASESLDAAGSAQAHYQLARLDFERRRFAEAAGHAKEALSSGEDFTAARLLLALSLAREGELEAARGEAERALSALPQEPVAHFTRAEVLLASGEVHGAIETYSRALELDPDFAPALERRAFAHRVREDFASATRDYGTLCEKLKSSSTGAYTELYLDWEKAEDVCFSYGMSYLLAGNLEKAARVLEETAEYTHGIRPDTAPIFFNALGRFHIEKGSVDEARRAYERGFAISREEPLSERDKKLWRGRYLHGMGRLAARTGDLEAALENAAEMKRMIDEAGEEGRPFIPSYHYLMGYIRVEEEAYEEALAHLEQADASDPFIQFLMARTYRGLDREREAAAIADRLAAERGSGFRHALVYDAVKEWQQGAEP